MSSDTELDVLVSWPFAVAVEKDAPVELKLKLIAASKAFELGNRSVDNMLKRHGETWRTQITSEKPWIVHLEGVTLRHHPLQSILQEFNDGTKTRDEP